MEKTQSVGEIMNFVVFDIWADYAQFKKPFTTMSPQTFSIPTGTAIVGLISAIVGLDKNEYWKYFPEGSFQMAVGVREVVKKVVIPINTLKTTSPKHFYRFEQHKQTTMEFIKDGKFRVWFAWDDVEHFLQLVANLKNHESYYTVSLGLAWNIADFKYVGLFEGKSSERKNDFIEICSTIPKRLIGENEEIDFENRKIFINNIPVRMKSDNSRIVEHYDEYLFDSDGNGIRAKMGNVLKVGGEYIIPL
ncbi:MAG: type I-B CRISPR-associated protein Cas5b [Candidatus Cloacimonetes bacterium]|nr:type I-B CRISPR-associated protein Cas5b [Candidatus Cloacimonadota bacterium]